MESIATTHCEMANTLEDDIRKNLKFKRKSLEQSNAKNFDDIDRSKNELRKILENMEKSERNQEKSMKDLEASCSLLEASADPAKKLNAEKIKLEHEKKSQIAHEAALDFAKNIRL